MTRNVGSGMRVQIRIGSGGSRGREENAADRRSIRYRPRSALAAAQIGRREGGRITHQSTIDRDLLSWACRRAAGACEANPRRLSSWRLVTIALPPTGGICNYLKADNASY